MHTHTHARTHAHARAGTKYLQNDWDKPHISPHGIGTWQSNIVTGFSPFILEAPTHLFIHHQWNKMSVTGIIK
jgi:hypothetical protein